MGAVELLELIARGEDSRTQFKRAQDVTNTKSLAGEMAAFANSKGGRILIGVDDAGLVIGLSTDDLRRINQLISNTATDCVRPSVSPETENISVDGKLVMVVTVPEGISKPYADREEVQRMLQSSELVYADEVPVAGTSSNDIDLERFSAFFARHYGERLADTGTPLDQMLNNLGLARDTRLNLAGLMLFGRNPQRYRPAFVVKAVSFVGNDPTGDCYRDSEDIAGCLRDLYKGTISFLTRNLRRVRLIIASS